MGNTAVIAMRGDHGPPQPSTVVDRHGSPEFTGHALFDNITRYHHGDLTSAATYLFRLHRAGFAVLGATPAETQCRCHGRRATAGWLTPQQLRTSPSRWQYDITDSGLLVRWEHTVYRTLVRWRDTTPDWERIENEFRKRDPRNHVH